MGVYGGFLTVFPELYETVETWFPECNIPRTKICAIYIPSAGDGVDRKKETSANWVADISTGDNLYVGRKYLDVIKVGSFVDRKGETYKAVQVRDYDQVGSFSVFKLERVQGNAPHQNKPLIVKEGTYR